MDFNTSTETSLIHDITFWTGADTASYPISHRTRNINEWYKGVNQLIWESDRSWQYDDSGYNTLPIAETDLVDSQTDYTKPSDAQRVMRVEVKDKDGNWRKLDYIDESDIYQNYDEVVGSEKAFPVVYDLMGQSILLGPAPDGDEVTTTSGLKVHVSRQIQGFSTDDTNTSPGFVEDFHRILSLGAAHDYLVKEDASQGKINRIKGEINGYREAMRKFYGGRQMDKPARFEPFIQSDV